MKVVNLEDIRHGIRVAKISRELAKILNMNTDDINNLYLACLYHDIGKAHINQSTLNKKEKLTKGEREHIEEHPWHSYLEMIHLGYGKDIANIILYHHENYDGSGYPKGLTGTQIPLGARILKIVDVFDALTMDRPYRKGLDLQEAVKVIDSEKSNFDPMIYEVFIDFLYFKYPNHKGKLGKLDIEVRFLELEDHEIKKLRNVEIVSSTGCKSKIIHR